MRNIQTYRRWESSGLVYHSKTDKTRENTLTEEDVREWYVDPLIREAYIDGRQ